MLWPLNLHASEENESANLQQDAVELEKGAVAPFTGTLLPEWLALQLTDDTCPEKRRADQLAAKEILGIRVQEQQDKRANDREKHQAKEKLLNEALKRETAFYRQPVFVAVGTLIVAGAVAVMIRCAVAPNGCPLVTTGATP